MERTLSVRDASGQPAPNVAAGLFLVLGADSLRAPPSRHLLAHTTEVVLRRGERRVHERRGAELTLRLPDRRMSGEHARLSRALGLWLLSDCRSKNGTFVNGKRIDVAALQDGDIVEAGHTFWLFREAITVSVDEALDHVGSLLPARHFAGLATLSADLAADLRRLARVAPEPVPIVIFGETGTGKEVVARASHALSLRRGAFVPVNCGALPDTLLEAQLFGYRRGAFSGALQDEPGLVRAADGGTLFLDEVGDLPLTSQTAFLRVLQEHEVTPVGATRPVRVDVRVVAATHRDIPELVRAGRFREDLWARLAGLTLRLPPLGARREDLGLLCGAILARHVDTELSLSRDAARAIMMHRWPLNIRELERALVLAAALRHHGEIELGQFPLELRGDLSTATRSAEDAPDDDAAPLGRRDLRRRAQILELLREHGGNISAVARAMGKARVQVQRWLKRYRIDADQEREPGRRPPGKEG